MLYSWNLFRLLVSIMSKNCVHTNNSIVCKPYYISFSFHLSSFQICHKITRERHGELRKFFHCECIMMANIATKYKEVVEFLLSVLTENLSINSRLFFNKMTLISNYLWLFCRIIIMIHLFIIFLNSLTNNKNCFQPK